VTPQLKHIVQGFLQAEKPVLFAYLFGSCARQEETSLSDIDIAVYLQGKQDFFTVRLQLMEALSRALKSDAIDLIVLNEARIVLKYEVIREGVVIKENKSERVLFETKVLREYLDSEPIRTAHIDAVKRRFSEKAPSW